MLTETEVESFEDVLQQFIKLFPERPWAKRVDAWPKSSAKNPFRAALIRKAQPVVFGIAAWEERLKSESQENLSDEMLVAMSFVAQIVELNKGGGDRNFLSRVRGALNRSHDMRALLFELQIAVHLFRQGCTINWTNESSGSKAYDMLVVPSSMEGLEIECKSFSVDKGEENTVEERLAVLEKVVPALKGVMPIYAGCICVLQIEFKGKISRDETFLNDIARQIIGAVGSGASCVGELCNLRFNVYDVSGISSKQTLSVNEVGRFLDRVSGKSSCVVMKQTEGAGWMAFSAVNARSSRLKRAILKDAKYAIREQMSGVRPGCLAIQLDGLVGSEMNELFYNQNSMLRDLAVELFDKVKHRHLAVILFASRPSLNVVGEYSLAEQGRVAVYENQSGDYVDSDYGHLFVSSVECTPSVVGD
ncbi:MAG: hypothetical protein ACN6P5_03660 [Pseudomonas protegens]